GARISLDIAPFFLATERNAVVGLNVVGLRRRGLSPAVMDEIKRAFRALGAPVGNLREIAASTLQQGTFISAEARSLLEFFQVGKRGFARPRVGLANDTADSDEEPDRPGPNVANNRSHWRHELGIHAAVLPFDQRDGEAAPGRTSLRQAGAVQRR